MKGRVGVNVGFIWRENEKASVTRRERKVPWENEASVAAAAHNAIYTTGAACIVAPMLMGLLRMPFLGAMLTACALAATFCAGIDVGLQARAFLWHCVTFSSTSRPAGSTLCFIGGAAELPPRLERWAPFSVPFSAPSTFTTTSQRTEGGSTRLGSSGVRSKP
jgi:hypothetical protein